MAGDILKKRREELGLEIVEMAELLKVRPEYIEAMETDRFDKFPAPVYAMGYIRSYAGYLGVDADPVIRFYRENMSGGQSTAAILPVGYSRKRNPWYTYLLPVLFLCGLLFFAYLKFYSLESATPVLDVPRSSAQDKSRIPPAASAPPEALPAQSTPAVPVPTTAPSVQKVPVSESGPHADNIAVRPSVPQGEHVLGVSANSDSWIFIRYADGKSESTLIKKGESRTWRFGQKIFLKIGNAGGIKLVLDGKDSGLIGNEGQVVTLSLPEN